MCYADNIYIMGSYKATRGRDVTMHEMWFVDLVFSVFGGLMVCGWVYDAIHTN